MKPLRGGSVTWALLPDIVPMYIFPFTPLQYYGTANLHEFQALMYRPLYWYGSDGRPEVDYDLSLAEPPEWSADGRTVTVTLKPWRWSNGERVCADNVMLWMHLLEEKKAEFGGYAPGYFPDNLSGYRKVNDTQVSFTFDAVYSKQWVLMNQLSAITPLPVAWDRTHAGPARCRYDKADAGEVWAYLTEQNADRKAWGDHPLWSVVNGPWVLQRCTLDESGGEAIFVPNHSYSGARKPHLSRLRLLAVQSNDAEYAMLQSGPKDPEAIQIGYLPFAYVGQPTDCPTRGGPNPLAKHYNLIPQTTFKITYFVLNFANPYAAGSIIRQAYFRQALQSVVDQEWAIREIYLGYGYPTTGPVPLLPESELISPRAKNTPFPFDPDYARELLAANGWDVSTTPAVCVDEARSGGVPLGTRLSLHLRYTEGYPGLAKMMAKLRDDAATTGIELRLSDVPANQIIVTDTTGRPNWELSNYNGGWIYGPGFHPTGEFLYKSGSNVNFGSYSDVKADALIAQTVTTDDPDVFYSYQDYIAAQVPVVWVPNFPVRLLEVAKNLGGVEPLNPYGLMNPENWYYLEESHDQPDAH
jgi:peptide/nickel transport system substrate-binding protein